jgi:uncharacterized repeat protein (TIGR03833 family)
MPGQYNKVPKRREIEVGGEVKVLQKKDYVTGTITKGVVKRILTSKAVHPRGIKVLLTSGIVGRVQALGDDPVVPLNAKPTRGESVHPGQGREAEPPGPDDII